MFCPAVVAATRSCGNCKEESKTDHYYSEKSVEDLVLTILEKINIGLKQLNTGAEIIYDHAVPGPGIACKLQKENKIICFEQKLEI